MRHPLGRIIPVLENVMTHFRDHAPVQEIAPMGSVRRAAETVGDLDIAIVNEDPSAFVEAFTEMRSVRTVLGAGPTRSSVLVEGDLQVDLRVVPADQWGSMLQYFTWSREHNVLLRERTRRQGLSLSEYGIKSLEKGGLEGFNDEADFYACLGLESVPPKIREGGREIDAAASEGIPRLVDTEDIVGDLHIHTDWSDGEEPMDAMVRAALERGLRYVAITDHSSGRGIARGLSAERLKQQCGAIEEPRTRFPTIEILHGSEGDIRADGSLDLADEVLDWLNLVVASIHSGMGESSERMTERLVRAIENPLITCIGHLSTRLIGERDPIAFDEETVFRAAVSNQTALEIDASPNRLDLNDAHAMRARELGVSLLINTDSHSWRGSTSLRYGVGVARRAWCTRNDILNTAPWPRFQELIQRKRELASAPATT